MIRFLCFATLAAVALPFAAMAQLGPPQERYIVVLNQGLDLPEDVAADVVIRTGGRVGYVYEHALRGFSITMPRAALAGVQRDPRVDYVEEDRPVSIFTHGYPTGIQRIFADDNADIGIDDTDDWRVDVDVAVIDTGIDSSHPDLNVVGGTNCLQTDDRGPPFLRTYYCLDSVSSEDDHNHGTHVAGTIGALDNGFGVVGVAPGARLWAVKVLDASGSGYESNIVAGIDWVASMANEIEVANMSLGGAGFSQAEQDAINGAVDAGVAMVVAAGNSALNLDTNDYSPAGLQNVLTVSALADFDGAPGGAGSPTCRSDQDDTLADFSNFGSKVEIAAPGVCIRSTLPGGGYGTFSGTSMASPHVAGAVALLASSNNPSNAGDVGNLYSQVIAAGNFDWFGDSRDGIQERLLDVSTFSAALIASDNSGGGAPTTPPSGDFTLSATGYKVKGAQHADLTWSGATSENVDIYRDGSVVATTANDGFDTDSTGQKGGGSASYQVCDTGTSTCSNSSTATW